MRKILFLFVSLLLLLSGCKKNDCNGVNHPTVDSKMYDYIFKTGSHWVYVNAYDTTKYDSMYVYASGTVSQRIDTTIPPVTSGMDCSPNYVSLPYMKIREYINGVYKDTFTITATTSLNQAAIWGFNRYNNRDMQVIYQVPPAPNIGTSIAPGVSYGGQALVYLSHTASYDMANAYAIDTTISGRNQVAYNTEFWIYPGYGVIVMREYGVPGGDTYWAMIRSTIIRQ